MTQLTAQVQPALAFDNDEYCHSQQFPMLVTAVPSCVHQGKGAPARQGEPLDAGQLADLAASGKEKRIDKAALCIPPFGVYFCCPNP